MLEKLFSGGKAEHNVVDAILQFAATPFPIEAPHFVAYVRQWLEDRYGLEAIYTQGLVVTTTLDLDWQNAAQSIAGRRIAELQKDQHDQPGKNVNNAAVAAIDPRSGEVLVMLGSPDYFDKKIDGAVNATIALRQPGSSIKPLTYAAAFDPQAPAPLTPASMTLDVRSSFPTSEGDPYVPKNYDRLYHGPVSAREARGGRRGGRPPASNSVSFCCWISIAVTLAGPSTRTGADR